MADLTTGLIHHPYVAPGGFEAPQHGVFKASTIFFNSVADMRQRYRSVTDNDSYTYGLRGTPTTYLLEERLCALEGGTRCVLLPSGLAAVALTSVALLRSGDEVLIPDNAYGPNLTLAKHELADWGITHRIYDPMDPNSLEAQISSRTKLVWVEAAGSVTLEFPDLAEMVRICKRAGVTVALDNTWGAGLAFRPFDLVPGESLGVDLSVHALTKYPSGGGDVLMGSITTRNLGLHKRLKLTHMRLGLGVAANDVELVLRSLPSTALRYRAHDDATRTLARWAQQQAAFVQVLHPALEVSPGHAHWKALCVNGSGGAAGLFSVLVAPRYTQAQCDAFCNSLRLFRLGYSWGGPISLVVPYELGSMRQTWPQHLAQGTLIRFSVGLEHVDDLRADLEQALAASGLS